MPASRSRRDLGCGSRAALGIASSPRAGRSSGSARGCWGCWSRSAGPGTAGRCGFCGAGSGRRSRERCEVGGGGAEEERALPSPGAPGVGSGSVGGAVAQNSSVRTRRGPARDFPSGRCRHKTLAQVLPLCRDQRSPSPGDGEAASLRGEEAAQRLPGVPDVLHRLVPPVSTPARAHGLHPSRTDTRVGKERDAAALVKENPPKRVALTQIPTAGGARRQLRCSWKPCQGWSLAGWEVRVDVAQPRGGLWHLVPCRGLGTQWGTGR